MSIQSHIAQLVKRALEDAQRRDLLPAAQVEEPPIERPQNPAHGDFASSIALKLARAMRMNPMTIAEKLVSLMPADEVVETVRAERPGFINFSLRPGWLAQQVDAIREARSAYGNVGIGAGQRVQVEYVSVNPTGPLHVAHARGGVIGSALVNILRAAGYDVTSEYYFNDAGAQIEHFKRSIYVRYQQLFDISAEFPPDGYHGAYVIDLAREIKEEDGRRFLDMPEREAIDQVGKIGLQKIMAAIREDVARLRISFDVWFNEASLYTDGQFEKAMKLLRERGFVSERDGAVWFTSTALGDEKDKVIVRSNGIPTYFASDVAYHYNKFIERKFDHVVNVWGADHQGHAAFLKAVIQALGIPLERLTLIINQIVTLKRGGELVRLSKRTGDMITLKEVIDEVGADACRYFFLSRSAESQMEFDLELAKQQSMDNPVYYIQYAHARIASILRLASDRGIDYADGDLSLLRDEAELALIRKMLELPELIEMMARNLEPHHLPHYALELATAFHWFYQQCRVVSSAPEDAGITRARLKLVEATKTALARCLELMIMEAPEHM
jgi:arginyl-tRNA synthetase